jgi:hypothetical protein
MNQRLVMKILKPILFCSLMVHFSVVAQQDTVLIKPLIAVKLAPFGLLAPDPNFQFQAEYFTRQSSSFEIGLGLGSNSTFKESDKQSTAIYRVEYKRYLQPFTNVKRAVGYFATELSHKDVLVSKVGYRKGGNNLLDLKDQANYQLDVNFTAIRLKYGYTFFGEKGFPIFNAFVGVGIGYTNNQNLNLPSGYGEEKFGMDLFRRYEGTGISLSLHGGVSLGAGLTRRR